MDFVWKILKEPAFAFGVILVVLIIGLNKAQSSTVHHAAQIAHSTCLAQKDLRETLNKRFTNTNRTFHIIEAFVGEVKDLRQQEAGAVVALVRTLKPSAPTSAVTALSRIYTTSAAKEKAILSALVSIPHRDLQITSCS